MAETAAAVAAGGLSGGQMACTMLFGTLILTYLGLEASRLRVLLRVRAPSIHSDGRGEWTKAKRKGGGALCRVYIERARVPSD